VHEKISGGKFKMSFGKFEDVIKAQKVEELGYNMMDELIACKNLYTIFRFRSPHIINVHSKNN